MVLVEDQVVAVTVELRVVVEEDVTVVYFVVDGTVWVLVMVLLVV